MDMMTSMIVAAAGMKAQNARMRVISENIANAGSTAANGDEPYRRQIPTFTSEYDRALGARLVTMQDTELDKSDFGKKFEPGHPLADEDGYILQSNVTTLIESMDMREAQRAFEANLNVIQTSRRMMTSVIGLLA